MEMLHTQHIQPGGVCKVNIDFGPKATNAHAEKESVEKVDSEDRKERIEDARCSSKNTFRHKIVRLRRGETEKVSDKVNGREKLSANDIFYTVHILHTCKCNFASNKAKGSENKLLQEKERGEFKSVNSFWALSPDWMHCMCINLDKCTAVAASFFPPLVHLGEKEKEKRGKGKNLSVISVHLRLLSIGLKLHSWYICRISCVIGDFSSLSVSPVCVCVCMSLYFFPLAHLNCERQGAIDCRAKRTTCKERILQLTRISCHLLQLMFTMTQYRNHLINRSNKVKEAEEGCIFCPKSQRARETFK